MRGIRTTRARSTTRPELVQGTVSKMKMPEPSENLRETVGQSTTIDLLELFDESESEDELEDLDVGEAVHNFLILSIKGPQLDEQMMTLLFNNGVEDL